MSEDKVGKKTKWRLTPHTLPIVYIILICIGYTEKSIFYNRFNIEIAPYLDFEEYLFIFLPVGAAAVMIVVFISIYAVGVLGANYALFGKMRVFGLGDTKKAEKQKEDNDIIEDKTNGTRKRLASLFMILLYISPFILILYISISDYFFESKEDFTLEAFILAIFWSVVMFILYLYSSFKDEDDEKKSILLYPFVMAIIVPAFFLIKINKAHRILQGKSKTHVSFLTDGKPIKTNDSLTFIGQTKGYLFLRNLNTGSNFIYKKDNISEIEIAKLVSSETTKEKPTQFENK